MVGQRLAAAFFLIAYLHRPGSTKASPSKLADRPCDRRHDRGVPEFSHHLWPRCRGRAARAADVAETSRAQIHARHFRGGVPRLFPCVDQFLLLADHAHGGIDAVHHLRDQLEPCLLQRRQPQARRQCARRRRPAVASLPRDAAALFPVSPGAGTALGFAAGRLRRGYRSVGFHDPGQSVQPVPIGCDCVSRQVHGHAATEAQPVLARSGVLGFRRQDLEGRQYAAEQ